MKLIGNHIAPGTLEKGDRVEYTSWGVTKTATVSIVHTDDAYVEVENDVYGHELGSQIGRYSTVYAGELRPISAGE